MRILIGLTYYRPHYSGLTIYTERLAIALAKRGHEVTVLTSRFSPDLKSEEICDGVRVVRLPTLFRISKGVIMPLMPLIGAKLIRKADIVNWHAPQFDAFYLALLSRIFKKPSVLTYHCDLLLPKGFIHRIANQVSYHANDISARTVDCIVTNTQDFAETSSFLRRYLSKTRVIVPPVELSPATDEDVTSFKKAHNIQPGEKIIGIGARLATEKGVEYLIEAMPLILKRYPNARVLHMGPYKNILGEEQYSRRLEPLIQALGDRWTFMGILSPSEKTAFFRSCDVSVLPSINSTESFGIVQIESMLCGTPVVASNLPGVRTPVQSTGYGRIVEPRDPIGLAEAILAILDNPEQYAVDPVGVERQYSPDAVASAYEMLFSELIH
ncbi:MAG TPA: glycosyltransferase family 4 protein [Anaerolineaceae bacterium]